MTTTGEGRGSVYKRVAKDGTARWAWSFTTGSRTNGTRRTHSKGGYPTQKAANKALTQAAAAYQGKGDRRPLMNPVATPTGEYLKTWLAGLPLKAQTTRRSYQTVVDVWTKPLHHVPLKELGPEDLLDLYAGLRESGSRSGKPLSSRSVQLTATVLGMALRDAVETGQLAYSPAARIPRRQRPKHQPEKHSDRVWTPDEAQRFLAANRDSRWYPLWALALDTGARRGELSALQWSELDLDAGTVTIKASRTSIGAEVIDGKTKTRKTRRVDLDPRTVRTLRQHLRRQMADKLEAGEGWAGKGKPGETGFVFVDEAGKPPRPDHLGRLFREAQQGVDVPPLVFHGLRHTSATAALSKGVSIVVVQKRLGHTTPSITLDVYSHALPDDGPAAARQIGTAIYGAEAGS
jgi:integrase